MYLTSSECLGLHYYNIHFIALFMFKFSKDYLWKPVCNWYQFLSLQMSPQVSCTYVLIPPQCTHFIRVRVFSSNT